MKNAIVRKALTGFMSAVLALCLLQPAMLSYAEEFTDEEFFEEELPEELLIEEEFKDEEFYGEDLEEEDFGEEELAEENFPEESSTEENFGEYEPSAAEAEEPVSAAFEEFEFVAVIRPDQKFPEDPDGTFGGKKEADELGEKALKLAAKCIPFGSIIYHLTREHSKNPSDPAEFAEDAATAVISTALDTLMPGSSSIFSVFKDAMKKLIF